MKKIFRKSNILSFLLGAIIFGGVGTVFAYTILAKDVSYSPKDTTWKVDNVKVAIDDLYTKAKPEYTGITTITPSNSGYNLSTKDKILKSNITIEPIPSTYKNLTTTTTVNESNLLSGVKAYTSDGELVTGTLSTNCVSGSYTKPANSQINIDFGFVPKEYTLLLYHFSNDYTMKVSYDNVTGKIYVIKYYDNTTNEWNWLEMDGTVLKSKLTATSGSVVNSYEIYYMACR